MALPKTNEYLRQEAAVWHADGVIDDATLARLRERWADASPWAGMARSLGIAGTLLGLLGVLGFVAALSRSELFGLVILAGSGGGLLAWSLRLATDPLDRHPHGAKVMMLLAVALVSGALGTACHLAGLEGEAIVRVAGGLGVILPLGLAYRFRNTFLLILALVWLFHWMGSMGMMMGRSSYVFDVQDPRLMAILGAVAVVVGIRHEGFVPRVPETFALVWKATGLLYLDACLLILSVFPGEDGHAVWAVVLAAVCLGQIVLGARLHDGALRGFGVTFFAIGAYTRFHEMFWDRMELGTYFLAGGVVLLAAGTALEAALRAIDRRVGA